MVPATAEAWYYVRANTYEDAGRVFDWVREIADGAAKMSRTKVQLAIDYDPHPPYGGIDYANIPRVPRAMRGAISLLAPAIAARSRKLLRQERAAGAPT